MRKILPACDGEATSKKKVMKIETRVQTLAIFTVVRDRVSILWRVNNIENLSLGRSLSFCDRNRWAISADRYLCRAFREFADACLADANIKLKSVGRERQYVSRPGHSQPWNSRTECVNGASEIHCSCESVRARARAYGLAIVGRHSMWSRDRAKWKPRAKYAVFPLHFAQVWIWRACSHTQSRFPKCLKHHSRARLAALYDNACGLI